MNAEDFMIGIPAAQTALSVDYLSFQIDQDRESLAKCLDYTYKLRNRLVTWRFVGQK